MDSVALKETQDVEREFAIKLDLDHGYQFDVKFDLPSIADLRVDETPPIGEGAGPSPTRMLATSIGHCLASSALFCLRKARIDVQGMTATVKGELVRNEEGHLRVGRMAVELAPRVAAKDVARMQRCLEIFEDFCVVTGAVRKGIDVDVALSPVTT
jgi:organic hydroperoxide reductase OsmC/OhrA